MVLKKRERGHKGLRKKKGEVGPIIKENGLSRNYFSFWILIKKKQENTMEYCLQGLLEENCFQVMNLLTLFGKWLF